MKQERRTILKIGAISVASLVAGCAYDRELKNATPRYFEDVDSVLISQDGQKLVIIGKTYHYIFDVPPTLSVALQRPGLKSGVRDLKLSEFLVDDDGAITGSFQLTLLGVASPQDRAAAIEAGFVDHSSTMSANGTLKGKRYAANGINISASSQKLSKSYRVVVRELTTDAKRKAAAKTPITIANEGLGMLVGVPLMLLVAPLLFIGVPPSQW